MNLQKKIIQLKKKLKYMKKLMMIIILIEASTVQKKIYKDKLKTLNDIFENSIKISDFNVKKT